MTAARRGKVGLGLMLAVVLAVAGCGDGGTGPEVPPVVSGSWSGTSQGITLNLTLLEGIGGSVSGSGNIAGPTRTSRSRCGRGATPTPTSRSSSARWATRT